MNSEIPTVISVSLIKKVSQRWLTAGKINVAFACAGTRKLASVCFSAFQVVTQVTWYLTLT